MGQKTRAFLKTQNRDFNNVLDSVATLSDAQTLSGALTKNQASTTTAVNTTTLEGKLAADPYAVGTVKLFPLGTELVYGQRTFRYAFMNGAVTAGKLLQQAPHVAHHINMTVTNADAVVGSYSHAIGSTTISVETNGTNLVVNEFADGYLLVNDAQGEGQLLRIKSHPAHVHGTDPSVVFTTYDPLSTAIVKNASQLSAHHNVYNHVIVAPAAETGAVVGATLRDMPDNNYGWVVTNGPAGLLAGENMVLGHKFMRSDADAGAVMPDNGDDLTPQLGQVMAGGAVDTEYVLGYLNVGI